MLTTVEKINFFLIKSSTHRWALTWLTITNRSLEKYQDNEECSLPTCLPKKTLDICQSSKFDSKESFLTLKYELKILGYW